MAGDGIHVVDVTDPARPVTAARIQDGEGGFDSLWMKPGRWGCSILLAVAPTVWRAAMTACRWSTSPTLPHPSPSAACGTARAASMRGGSPAWRRSSHLAAATMSSLRTTSTGVHVVDVTDPDAPALAGGLRAGVDGFELLGGAHGIDGL